MYGFVLQFVKLFLRHKARKQLDQYPCLRVVGRYQPVFLSYIKREIDRNCLRFSNLDSGCLTMAMDTVVTLSNIGVLFSNILFLWGEIGYVDSAVVFPLTRPRETSLAETALAPQGGSRRRVARRPAPSGCGSRWSWPPDWEIHKVNEIIKISYPSSFLHLWYLAVSYVVPLLPDVDQRGGDAEGNLVGKPLGDPEKRFHYFSMFSVPKVPLASLPPSGPCRPPISSASCRGTHPLSPP